MQFNDNCAVRKAALVTLFVLVISASDTLLPSSNTDPIYLEVIFQSNQCGTHTSAPSLEVVSSQQQLDLLIQRLDRHTLGKKRQPYLVNFKKMNVLFLEMGYRPTAGYRLLLSDEKVRLRDNEAIVEASWAEPPADSLQAQVITRPCLIFILPKSDYSK